MLVPVRSVDSAFGSHDHSWSLTVRAEEIERWRHTVGAALSDWRATREAVELARLGVSELLANVAKHTVNRRCCLRTVRVGADVMVQVFDESKQLPVLRTPDWCSESGRGLWLLREMADGFGYMPMPFSNGASYRLGKVVWFSCWGAFPGAGAE
ncbi:ATP-binding protein [Streptomyces sedi]|uniref:ATP-binding protein n=1 Tax=Streptomyces sedi TaxID=555059 RepID=UPI001B85DE02|nr:ATP-binding protein [Streptomyces sedi]